MGYEKDPRASAWPGMVAFSVTVVCVTAVVLALILH